MRAAWGWWVVVLLLAGCGEASIKGSYQPPLIAVAVEVDSRGNVSLSPNAQFVTPLGSFQVGVDLPVVNADEILVVLRSRSAGRDQVFKVTAGRNVCVTSNGITRIQAGADGVFIVDVTGAEHRITIAPNCDIGSNPPPLVDGQTDRCADNGLPPRLYIGATGWVLPDPPLANLLRYEPDNSSSAFERIEPGRTFAVLDGPVCADNIYWWYVQSYEGVRGWAAEGDDGTYYIVLLHRTIPVNPPLLGGFIPTVPPKKQLY